MDRQQQARLSLSTGIYIGRMGVGTVRLRLISRSDTLQKGQKALLGLRIFDRILIAGDFVNALGAIQFQDRIDLDLPDALLEREFLLAFDLFFVFTAAQLALNLDVCALLEGGGEICQ